MVRKYLQKWAKVGRIYFHSRQLTANLSEGLRRLHFDRDDDVFVAVASKTSSGWLVAEESDYSDQVITFLSGYGVRVIHCETAKTEIDRPFR